MTELKKGLNHNVTVVVETTCLIYFQITNINTRRVLNKRPGDQIRTSESCVTNVGLHTYFEFANIISKRQRKSGVFLLTHLLPVASRVNAIELSSDSRFDWKLYIAVLVTDILIVKSVTSFTMQHENLICDLEDQLHLI